MPCFTEDAGVRLVHAGVGGGDRAVVQGPSGEAATLWTVDLQFQPSPWGSVWL